MKAALKRLRASQPFNSLATTTLRGITSGIGRPSEFLIKHLPRVGTVARRLPNGRMLRLWSHGDDWVSNQVFWRGWQGYEPETTPLFFRLAERASVTFDVGAHVGYYALLAGHANPEARVYAFEPMAATCARLRRNIELNGLANIEVIEAAAGDRDGMVEFFAPDGEIPCSAGMSEGFYQPWADAFSRIEVESVTLDRFVQSAGIARVDLIKLDTESTEPQVLRGMHETLKRDRPAIICEVLCGCGSEEPLAELLAPLGYRFYLLTSAGPELRDRIEGHPVWLNYLFSERDPGETAQRSVR